MCCIVMMEWHVWEDFHSQLNHCEKLRFFKIPLMCRVVLYFGETV